jgi:hypothetical protein
LTGTVYQFDRFAREHFAAILAVECCVVLPSQWRASRAFLKLIRMNQPLHSSLRGTHEPCRDDCASTAPGHGLPQIQERVASATPSKWVDALVIAVSASGRIDVAVLSDDSTLSLWNHSDLTGSVSVGDPVGVHSVYDVLAVGNSQHNVRRAIHAG